MRDCRDILHESSNIRFINIHVEEFYNNLNRFPDGKENPTLNYLDNSFCACIGGAFRSPRMARYLEQKGIKLADKKCRNGFRIEDMAEVIDKTTVRNDEVLIPKGFQNPMSNLFIGNSNDTETCEGCLLLFVNSLLKKRRASASKIKLDIYLVDGDEKSSANIYRALRAYDPDLDDPEKTPIYKGI